MSIFHKLLRRLFDRRARSREIIYRKPISDSRSSIEQWKRVVRL